MLHNPPARPPPPSPQPPPSLQVVSTLPSSSSSPSSSAVPSAKRRSPSPAKPPANRGPPPLPSAAAAISRNGARSDRPVRLLRNMNDGPTEYEVNDGNSDNDGMAYVNRWSQSTASSRRSSAASDTPYQPQNPVASSLSYHQPAKTTSTSTTTPGTPSANPTPYQDLDFFGSRTRAQPGTATALRDRVPGPAATAPSAVPDKTRFAQPQLLNNQDSRPGTSTGGRDSDMRAATPPATRSGSRDRGRRRRGSSQKTMLSKALQKANTAVLLDNAANYEGAIEAYVDACGLLQQVTQRTGGSDEKQKLEEIQNTYTVRVSELRRLNLSSRSDGKALPERPSSDGSLSGSVISPLLEPAIDDTDDQADVYEIGTATSTRIRGNTSQAAIYQETNRSLAPSQIPPRRQSLLPTVYDERPGLVRSKSDNAILNEKSYSPKKVPAHPTPDSHPGVPVQPSGQAARTPPSSSSTSSPSDNPQTDPSSHTRAVSNGTTSWLDTIEESNPSSPSSIASRSSTLYLRRRHDRTRSGGTEAEFDAALDAAVEAAYDEGFEPAVDFDDYGPVSRGGGGGTMSTDDVDVDDVVSNVRRNIELAKQKVREAELEAEAFSAKGREQRRLQEEARHGNFGALTSDYDQEEVEEEERILEEMMDDFEFDVQSKSALPRQSNSSGFSRRTAGSSLGSNVTAAGTSLSTLAEEDVLLPPSGRLESKPSPLLQSTFQSPPRTSSPLPPIPTSQPLSPQGAPTSELPFALGSPINTGPSVRARRLSGQNPKDLVIETTSRFPAGAEAPRTMPPSMPLGQSAFPRDEPKTSLPALGERESKLETMVPSEKASLPASEPVTASIPPPSPSNPTAAKPPSRGNEGDPAVRVADAVFTRVNPPRPIKVSIPSEAVGQSPTTPLTGGFPRPDLRKVPTFGNFPPQPGLNIFDTDIHSPTTPGSPNPASADAPMPLEPCPQSFLLRPFWLMRCLYQSLCHPRGGYITTKLFIPTEVWRVKSVKLKAVDEKISNCDLLTAALLKLAKVDMYDADAVLEEMQALETTLDQIQAVLSKKLGNEVGVQGSMALFKVSQEDTSPMTDQSSGKSTSGSSKSYLTSWRKLRSKSSGTGFTPSTAALAARDGSSRDTMTLNSLPMVETPDIHYPKKSATDLQCSGPNANYMNALARLFDAAQIIDQIARQVEDPGLRHSSQTLVGLELSTRHAAEFFGFYICRFALSDVGLMMEKFIKRGSEWVLT